MWVDAICIDQINIPERNNQVGLMRYIYSIAQRTVVYLGKSDTRCDEILVVLQSGTASEDIKNSAITQIVSLPWFTRVWVYQELVLSREVWVQCFRIRMSWDDMCVALIGINRGLLHSSYTPQPKENDSTALLTGMHITRESFKMSLIDGRKSPSLKHILSHRRGFRVSDLRDIIYGHLAVAGLPRLSEDMVGVFPDVAYSKSVSEVFTDAAAYIYTSSDQIDLILEVEEAEYCIRRQDLPSWVPDWSLSASKLLPSIPPEFLEQTQRFPDDTHKEIYCFRNLSVLAFNSFELTAVEEASTFIFPSLLDIWQRECEVYEKMILDFNETGSRDTIPPECIETGDICHNLHQFWQQQLGDGFLPHLELKTLIPKVSVTLKALNGDKEGDKHQTFLELFLEDSYDYRFIKALPGRRMALLANLEGRGWALVPRATRPGDMVYPLRFHLGLMHTAVLRPCEILPAVRLLTAEELQAQGCDVANREIFHCRFIGISLIDTRYRDQLSREGQKKRVVALY